MWVGSNSRFPSLGKPRLDLEYLRWNTYVGHWNSYLGIPMSNIGIPTQVLTQVFQGQGSDKYLAVLNMYLHRSTHRYGNVLYDNDGHSFISLTSLNTCTFCVVLVSSKVLEVFGKVFLEYIVFGTNEQDLRNFQSEKVLQLCIRQAIIFNLYHLHLRATATIPTYNQLAAF